MRWYRKASCQTLTSYQVSL
ncbi:hypothetical protein E2C01_060711 [Portunus trituberculatus]|uniref:Uncharacterized protein n=1 Tax=Portunus trituberculatus TaxID=210409 RepID=A0A5B7H693_PORTR|nr:hypothetical protein [Portunus trituberculatus]